MNEDTAYSPSYRKALDDLRSLHAPPSPIPSEQANVLATASDYEPFITKNDLSRDVLGEVARMFSFDLENDDSTFGSLSSDPSLTAALEPENAAFSVPNLPNFSKGASSTDAAQSHLGTTSLVENPFQQLQRPPRHPQHLNAEIQQPRHPNLGISAGSKTFEPASLQTFNRVIEDREQKRKRKKKKSKLDEFFDEKRSGSVSRDNERVEYKCKHCNTVIVAKKTSSRLFHVITCAMIPLKTRGAFFIACRDKDKPPLLEKPFPGMTVSDAKKVVEEEKQRRNEAGYSHSGVKADPTCMPHLAQYLLAKMKINPNSRIGECSASEQEEATKILLEVITEENLPFSICDNRERFPRGLTKLLGFLRPGYILPRAHQVGGELLDRHYARTLKDMRNRLRDLLPTCYATLSFDGSEDINGAPMINVLLRLAGDERTDTRTFFLTSVYTGYHTVDATYYVNMAEEVITKFVGMKYVAGIVTDNTGSVKNAREALEQRYGRVVASQDQAHVADRLMGDIGEIKWVRETVEILTNICSDLRRFRKLRSRLFVLMEEYNKSRRQNETAQNTVGRQEGEGEVIHSSERNNEKNDDNGVTNPIPGSNVSEDHDVEDEDCTHDQIFNNGFTGVNGQFFNRCVPSVEEEEEIEHNIESELGHVDDTQSATAVPAHSNESTTRGNQSERLDEAVGSRRGARVMKRLSAVRFASNEKLLDEYITLRPVLLLLVDDPLFPTLYKAKNEAARVARKRSFVDPIKNDELLLRVKQVHSIFRGCTTYLRVFDSETALASEVFEATRILEDTLDRLPNNFYPEPCVENREELLEVFRNRKEGPFPGRKRVQIRLLSDLHIVAVLLDPYRTPIRYSLYMPAFRRHLVKYLQGLNLESIGVKEEKREQFIDEMLSRYISVRAIWRNKGLLRERSQTSSLALSNQPTDSQSLDRSIAKTSTCSSEQARMEKSPIAWWHSGFLPAVRDGMSRKAQSELIEFAARTLSVSPTATATERTFSLENRIHTKQRASLSTDKVRKILFCQWNGRVMREFADRDEVDLKIELERQTETMRRLRSVKVAATSASKEDSSHPQESADAKDSNRAGARDKDTHMPERPITNPRFSDPHPTSHFPFAVVSQPVPTGYNQPVIPNTTLTHNLGTFPTTMPMVVQAVPQSLSVMPTTSVPHVATMPVPLQGPQQSPLSGNGVGWVQIYQHTTTATYPGRYERIPSNNRQEGQGHVGSKFFPGS